MGLVLLDASILFVTWPHFYMYDFDNSLFYPTTIKLQENVVSMVVGTLKNFTWSSEVAVT